MITPHPKHALVHRPNGETVWIDSKSSVQPIIQGSGRYHLYIADVLVAATPIYFADISAQLKIFVDRCYSYLEPFETIPEASRLKAGKRFVLITAQNRGEDMFAEVCTKYRMIFEFLGFKETHLIRGCDLMKADALKTKNRKDLIDLSKETARKVVKLAV
jgi:multimeric flavodoxin WrbA